MMIEIRRAEPEDATTLTEISHTAKRHWGYPEHWIQHWSADLTITTEFITNNEVYVVTNAIKRNILPLLALLAVFVIAAPVSLAVRRAPEKAVNNQQLLKQIRKELVTLPYYGVFDNLAYQVNGSTVTLYGQVVRPTTKSDAENRVARLSGVTRVINRIEVLPLSSFDDSIRQRTYRELVRTGGLYRYFQGANPSIHIVVDRGRVTLEGVVDNRGDAQLAYLAALRAPGSFAVTNHLTVGEKAAGRIAV